MDANDKGIMANIVGWLGLILSIVALVLAWMAFDRASEENLGDMIRDQVQDTMQVDQPTQPGVDDTGDDVITPGTDGGVNDDVNTQEDGVIAP